MAGVNVKHVEVTCDIIKLKRVGGGGRGRGRESGERRCHCLSLKGVLTSYKYWALIHSD